MRAGRLDRSITIQQKTVTRTTLGDETESWADLATVWSEVIPMSGREYFNAQAQQVVVEEQLRFRIRYFAAAASDTELRISYNSKVYDITHIAEMGRRVGLELVGKALAQ